VENIMTVELSAVAVSRTDAFFAQNPDLRTPYLVVDLDVVRDRYQRLRTALPQADVYFAVKANPDPAVIRVLDALGSNFDVASVGEIELCANAGVAPARMSYGNMLKKESDIAAAYRHGVRIFTADSEAELGKILRQVNDSTLLVRLALDCAGADWPLSRKFGCSEDEARRLLAAGRGIRRRSRHTAPASTGRWTRTSASTTGCR
jgi:ornithine decarboxylase